MIHVDFDPDRLEGDLLAEWQRLRDRAREETAELLAIWRERGCPRSEDFKPKVWGEFKVFLLEHVFHDKCAYCETSVKKARQPGDAEHYRPKLRVDVPPDDGGRTRRAEAEGADGEVCDHPGYFWLAYWWENLLPACITCNRNEKRNLFPVGDRHVLTVRLTEDERRPLTEGGREDLDLRPIPCTPEGNRHFLKSRRHLDAREQPLLLHPYRDRNPGEHLRFHHGGRVVALTEKGRHSIETYGLDNPGLVEARHKAQDLAYNRFNHSLVFYQQVEEQPRQEALRNAWAKMGKWLSGEEAHSAAGLDYLAHECGFKLPEAHGD